MCAQDAAGWISCAEASVGVPLTPMMLKHIVPENQGKLFQVAQDKAIWNAPVDELSFRQLIANEGLDMPVPPAYNLCYSNYILTDGSYGNGTVVDTVQECAMFAEDLNAFVRRESLSIRMQ